MRLMIIAFILVGGGFLLTHDLPFGQALLVVLVPMTALWLLSLLLKDASIVDIFWGPGFAIVMWWAMWVAPDPAQPRDWLLAGLVTIWALRLGGYIFWRNHGKGEDYRYQQWREEGGKHWWLISWFQVFLLQGLLLWVISSILVASRLAEPQASLQWLDWVGLALWLVGFWFEAVGDWQLARFKANPDNKGKVMDQGLWGLTRHPNYFGEFCMWWGYFLFCAATAQWLFVFSPILMSVLLMKVSGVTLLEEGLKNSKPGYADYVRKVPAFFPKPRFAQPE